MSRVNDSMHMRKLNMNWGMQHAEHILSRVYSNSLKHLFSVMVLLLIVSFFFLFFFSLLCPPYCQKQSYANVHLD